MKKIWIPMFLAAASTAANRAEKPEPDVIVIVSCGGAPATVVGSAEVRAARMLASAGVTVAWRLDGPNDRGRAEIIEAVLTQRNDPEFMPGALAFAALRAQSGPRIEIFYDRVKGYATILPAPFLLAHVLAHEITHILEGVKRHSPSGIMKAHWDISDLRRMLYSPLPLAEDDVALVHGWLERHNRPLVAGLR